MLRTKMLIAGLMTVVVEVLIIYALFLTFNIPLSLLSIVLPLFWLFQWLIGPYLIGRNEEEIRKDDSRYGWVYEMVEEIARPSKIKTPKVYISNLPFPNAYAYGNLITGRRIAITKPLLEILSKDELKAVIGHELGHLKHFDVEIGLAIGLIPSMLGLTGNLLANLGYGLLFFGDEAALLMGTIFLAVGILLIALTFLINLFALWFNRLRELFADEHAINLFQNEAINLARALAKIEIYMRNVRVDPFKGLVLTVPPSKIKESDPDKLLSKWLEEKISPFADFLSTHPHTARRIKMIYNSSNLSKRS